MNNCIYGDMYEKDKFVRQRFEIYRSLLAPFFEKRGKKIKILDIGCYSGDILRILPKNVDYVGVDSDKKALEIAHQRGARVQRVDLENEPIPLLEKFDIIIISELLEHLKNPEKIFLQIKELLNEGGIVLISLPNECTAYHRFKVLFGRGIDGTGFEPHYHLHFPTLKQNREFIEKHFTIVETRYWFHLGVGGGFEKILSIIPQWLWAGLAHLFPSLFARGGIYLCRR